MIAPTATQLRARARQAPQRYPGALRVTGTLTAPAQLRHTVGPQPKLLLCVQLQPATGLPYHARIDLGTDRADHMAAEAMLPHLRAGAVLSVAGAALDMHQAQGREALRVLGAHSAVLLQQAPRPTPQAMEA
jgi:hypothetical protein